MIMPAGHSVSVDGSNDVVKCYSHFERSVIEYFRNEWEYDDFRKALMDLERWDWYDFKETLIDSDPDPGEAQMLVQRLMSDMDIYYLDDLLYMVYQACSNRYIHHSIKGAYFEALGYKLPSDKLLYVSVPSGDELGFDAHGVVVSSAESSNNCGRILPNSGVLIQAAPSGGLFGGEDTDGLCVALEEPESYGDNSDGLVVRHDEVSDDLRSYCDSLVDICNAGEDAVYREFGDFPATTIRKNIYDLVDWHPEGWCG